MHFSTAQMFISYVDRIEIDCRVRRGGGKEPEWRVLQGATNGLFGIYTTMYG